MAEIHSVYLAGKIEKNGWREKLKEKMWFIDKMQRNTAVASYKWISTELISKFKEEK